MIHLNAGRFNHYPSGPSRVKCGILIPDLPDGDNWVWNESDDERNVVDCPKCREMLDREFTDTTGEMT